MKRFSIFFLVAGFSLLAGSKSVFATCPGAIANFPYTEDFETGTGGWITNGVNNDWTYGSPTKPIINSAASGSNCWITGGLTASFYQYGERSWVQSPCFDFSTLDFPTVSFMIYWETENQYDGGNFQYSLDAGVTWSNVGDDNEPSDCFTQNWFNRANIANLSSLSSPANGWCGTSLPTVGNCQGGNGSNEWKLAKHCLKNLAHQPEVLFRFTFGAGTQCNAFDGLAFDDFQISEATPTMASFTFSCISQNEVEFSNSSVGCITGNSWSFGDGALSTVSDPSHVFPAEGSYIVTLITNSTCSASDTFSLPVTLLSAQLNSTDESCPGSNDGTATVSVSPPGAYQYSWSTIPVQTSALAANLAAGSYSVTISGVGVCSITESIQVLASPSLFSASVSSVSTSCAGINDGMAVLTIYTPGAYSISWNTVPVQTTDTAIQLAPGSYTATVTGPGICSPATFSADVIEGDQGNPGEFLGTDTFTCTGTELVLYAGDFSSCSWDDGTQSISRTVFDPGIYFATVVTDRGCTGSDTIIVEERCLDEILIPTSFTPNNDGLNDIFYAYGTGIKSFSLRVFDRWGNQIFQSNTIDEGWDGTFAGHRVQQGIYTCVVAYSIDGQSQKSKKGMIVLIY